MVYDILTRRQPYHDSATAYLDQLERQRVEQRLVRRLERPATPSASRLQRRSRPWPPEGVFSGEGIILPPPPLLPPLPSLPPLLV